MSNFKLRKVKLRKDKGVDVDFEIEKVEGDTHHVVEKSHRSPIVRHPDMDKVAKALLVHVARIFKLGGVDDQTGSRKLNKSEQERLDKAVESMTINSVSFTGSADNETAGVLISAKMTTLNNRTVVLNTPNLMFGDEANYGYINKLEDDAEDLAVEVGKYVNEAKYGQLSLFTPEEGKEAA